MFCCMSPKFIRDSERLGEQDRSKSCVECQLCIDRLDRSHEINVGKTDGHTIAYYSISNSEITVNIGAGVSDATGSVSIKQGTPLVKMFEPIPSEEESNWMESGNGRWSAEDYKRWFQGNMSYCTSCFEKVHNSRFRSSAVTLKGNVAIINSDYELNQISVGNF